jgi:anti-sigma B factor antagonist
MEIKLKKYQTIYIIQVIGELTIYSAETLKETFQKMLDQKVDNFVIDLTETEYIDSSGIGALVFIKNTLDHSHPKKNLRIVNCNNEVKKIIQLARLTDFFPLADNLKQTIWQMNEDIKGHSNSGGTDQIP